MSALRQAAKAVLDQWGGSDWMFSDMARINATYSALRTALEAEQAQAVDAMKATSEDMLIYRNIAKQAQQVAVPMTSQEMSKCWLEADGTRYGYAPFARAIEAHHGIGAKP